MKMFFGVRMNPLIFLQRLILWWIRGNSSPKPGAASAMLALLPGGNRAKLICSWFSPPDRYCCRVVAMGWAKTVLRWARPSTFPLDIYSRCHLLQKRTHPLMLREVKHNSLNLNDPENPNAATCHLPRCLCSTDTSAPDLKVYALLHYHFCTRSKTPRAWQGKYFHRSQADREHSLSLPE